MTDPTAPRPRMPLDPDRLEHALRSRGASGWTPRLLHTTASTNADALAAAAEGAAAGLVVVAEEQTAGRGRLDRRWTAPPSSSLLVSVLLRPTASLPVRTWGWLPLLAGLAAAGAVQETAGVDARLKWPNDVVVDGPGWLGDPGPRKLAGLLVEAAGGAVVVGLGLNVDLGPQELTTPQATSLVLEAERGPVGGRVPAREDLLAAVLAGLGRRVEAFVGAAGDADRSGLRDAYTARCLTLGRAVRATLPGGQVVEGVAAGVAAEGALVVATASGERTVPAGDVVHLGVASG